MDTTADNEEVGRWAAWRMVDGKKMYEGRKGDSPDDMFTHMTEQRATIRAFFLWPNSEIGADMVVM